MYFMISSCEYLRLYLQYSKHILSCTIFPGHVSNIPFKIRYFLFQLLKYALRFVSCAEPYKNRIYHLISVSNHNFVLSTHAVDIMDHLEHYTYILLLKTI